jgi:hypothetical protein
MQWCTGVGQKLPKCEQVDRESEVEDSVDAEKFVKKADCIYPGTVTGYTEVKGVVGASVGTFHSVTR